MISNPTLWQRAIQNAEAWKNGTAKLDIDLMYLALEERYGKNMPSNYIANLLIEFGNDGQS